MEQPDVDIEIHLVPRPEAADKSQRIAFLGSSDAELRAQKCAHHVMEAHEACEPWLRIRCFVGEEQVHDTEEVAVQ